MIIRNTIKSLCIFLTSLLFLIPLGTHAEQSQARLVSEYQSIDGKEPFWVLLHLKLTPAWHSYWKNPGDSGLPTQINWRLPRGFKASDILWQVPQRISVGPLMTYGYQDNAYHLVKITPPQEGYDRDTLHIEAQASWLVCKKDCIPEDAVLPLSIPITDHNEPSNDFPLIQSLVVRTLLAELTGKFSTIDDTLLLTLAKSTVPNADRITSAYFFPDQEKNIVPAASQILKIDKEHLSLELKLSGKRALNQLSGILELKDKDNTYHYYFHSESSVNTAQVNDINLTLGFILLFAFLGGIILNLMPCVFPVLSIKIFNLIQKTSQQKKQIIHHGLCYTVGILLSFLIIASVLLLMRYFGWQVGWGFQMQSPTFIAILSYILWLAGLNLSGFFDLFITVDIGKKTASREDLFGSFMTGVLATLVATPCTGPFMATALGAALTQSTPVALAIFLLLGLGLAFPYLLITLIPATVQYLPKPGKWMVTIKEFLAFPLYLSVIWLLWIFMHQVNANTTAILLCGLLLTGFSIWLWQNIPAALSKARMLVALVLILMCALPFIPIYYSQATPLAKKINHYSEAKLSKLLEADQRVLVYASAAWCITCKLNEVVALDSKAVKTALRLNNITLLKADWTQSDPAVTAFLAKFGRTGIPLYVYFPGKSKKPIVLPQLLTPNIILDAISKSSVTSGKPQN